MYRLTLVYLLLFMKEAHSHADFHPENLPKCCQKTEFLGNQLECVPNNKKESYFVASNKTENFFAICSWNEFCMDYLDSESRLVKVSCFRNESYTPPINKTLHKCCPPGSSYNRAYLKCVRDDTENVFRTGFDYVHVGLSTCKKAIVDYTVDDIVYTSDKRIKLPQIDYEIYFENYCVDKEYEENTYVVRVCHKDFDVCQKNTYTTGKVRCLKKCCPDGHVFVGGKHCEPTFEHGISFNDSRILDTTDDGTCAFFLTIFIDFV